METNPRRSTIRQICALQILDRSQFAESCNWFSSVKNYDCPKPTAANLLYETTLVRRSDVGNADGRYRLQPRCATDQSSIVNEILMYY